MSFVIVAPEMVSAAATDLARIGSSISAANAGAALPTTQLLAAGVDEVSEAIAAKPAQRQPQTDGRARGRGIRPAGLSEANAAAVTLVGQLVRG